MQKKYELSKLQDKNDSSSGKFGQILAFFSTLISEKDLKRLI